MTITNTMIREKPCRILLAILDNKEPNVQMLGITIGLTYCYVWNIIDVFHRYELINKKRKGRVICITLTTKGAEIAKRIKMIYNALGEIDAKARRV